MRTIPEIALVFSVFVVVTGIVIAVYLLLSRRDRHTAARLEELAQGQEALGSVRLAQWTQEALPKLGQPLLPTNREERSRLQSRLHHAGLYSPRAVPIFLGVKMLFILGPMLLVLLVVLFNLVPPTQGALAAAIAGLIGMISPGLWLDYHKNQRQIHFRRSLPDALDVIVICLEGGLSLRGGLRRVVTELWNVHPVLADEMAIVEREILLGRTTGEALGEFSRRCDLEEVRSLASLVSQSEQFGTSIVKALVIYSDMLRQKRQQMAEETAQKAATKILFPTLLFIFPALFVVILGPAAIQLAQLLSRVG